MYVLAHHYGVHDRKNLCALIIVALDFLEIWEQPRNPRPSLLLLAKCHKLTAEVNYGTADNRGLLAGCCSVVFRLLRLRT